MNHSITVWNFAQSPNYTTNIDKLYPYSEVPYIGNYKLVKIPITERLDHVDYWGEGKISTQQGDSGFRDCYNVNHQYQTVSNGPDKGKKIPNRIPTISYTNCDTSSYIKDNSVKTVTLMGAPINKSCAKDMARIVNSDTGKVLVFGFTEKSADAINISEELKKKYILYCHGYQLPEFFKGLTLFDGTEYQAYLNISGLTEELYNSISEISFDNAANICKTLENNDNGMKVSLSINRLLKEGNKNVMMFAYKLFSEGAIETLHKYFPIVFKLIFHQNNVRIINKMNLFALNLEVNETMDKGLAKALSSDKANEKALWRIIPATKNDDLSFKILNLESGMFLTVDNETDKKVKGILKDTDAKVQWSLEPTKVDDDTLFYIINRNTKQGLVLEDVADFKSGEKQAVGYEGSMFGNPEKYGWFIAPQQLQL